MSFLAAASSCKPAASTGSETKSLDNFTRAPSQAVTVNDCGLDMEARKQPLSVNDKKVLDRIEAPTPALQMQAVGALTAVPKPLVTMFYLVSGKIRVVADADAVCKGTTLNAAEKRFAGEGQQSLDGCWIKNGDQLEVIVKADKTAIHHSMVRLFGYVYTQFVAGNIENAKVSADQKKKIADALTRLSRQRKNIGDALLADLAKRGGATVAKFNQFAASDAEHFDNFSTSEAIDSYYCSKATRKIFASDFPETYRVFTSSNASLQADLGKAFDE